MSFIFPPPPMVPTAAMTTIKLALESAESDGPFVRIQLTRKIGQGATELLQKRALELYRMSHPEQDLDDAKVYLTYRDTENDRCFILSVEDLQSAMAFSSGTLRVLARVEIPAVSNASASTQTAHSEGSFVDSPVHKVVEAAVGVLTAASIALQNHIAVDSPPSSPETVNRGVSTGTEEAVPKSDTETSSESSPFIHGRHTCDGCLKCPIVGKRFHALNLPNYDLCAACKDKCQGEITFEEAENEHDARMQERWNRRFNKWSKKSDKQHESWCQRQERGNHPQSWDQRQVCGQERRSCSPPSENAERSLEQGDQASKQAVGQGNNNNDKEHKAENKTSDSETSETAESSTWRTSSVRNEKPVEQQVEEAMQEAENALKKVGPALKQAIRRSVRNVKHSAKKVEEDVLKEVGPAIQEAIRWSMRRSARAASAKQPPKGSWNTVPEPKKPSKETVQEETTIPAVGRTQDVRHVEEIVHEKTVIPAMGCPQHVEPEVAVLVAFPSEETISPVQGCLQEQEIMVPSGAAPVGTHSITGASKEHVEEVTKVTCDTKPGRNHTEQDGKEEEDLVVQVTFSNEGTTLLVNDPPQELDFLVLPVAPVGAHPATSVPKEVGNPMTTVTNDIMLGRDYLACDEKEAESTGEKHVKNSLTSCEITMDVAVKSDVIKPEFTLLGEHSRMNVIGMDASKELKPSAIILDEEELTGDDDESYNSWDDNNSWGIVNGDGALAQAAQMIGSALFESGISSQPTTVEMHGMESVTNRMQRWSAQLSKLHELGFKDDKTNVEIMERLEAADIGSGESEEISVEHVVNEILKEW